MLLSLFLRFYCFVGLIKSDTFDQNVSDFSSFRWSCCLCFRVVDVVVLLMFSRCWCFRVVDVFALLMLLCCWCFRVVDVVVLLMFSRCCICCCRTYLEKCLKNVHKNLFLSGFRCSVDWASFWRNNSRGWDECLEGRMDGWIEGRMDE